MMRPSPRTAGRPWRAPQRGISLVISLVLLLAITLIGLAAIGSSSMQEKIVGNDKDMNLALQAAEACLRDAETDIAQDITSATTFSSAGTNGLWSTPSSWATPSSAPLWQSVDWSGGTASLGTTRQYGQYTGATLPGAASTPSLYAAPPRYVIEKLSTVTGGTGQSVGIGLGQPPSVGTYYRITAYATGGRSDTHVVMQSIYFKP